MREKSSQLSMLLLKLYSLKHVFKQGFHCSWSLLDPIFKENALFRPVKDMNLVVETSSYGIKILSDCFNMMHYDLYDCK